MSYEIIYALEGIKFTAEEVGSHEDKYILVGQCGSNNCYEAHGGSNGRRSRDWSILAVGGKWQVMGTMVERAASCEGGMLKPFGRDCPAETFIRQCRKALDNAVHGFDGAYKRGLSFDLRIRFFGPTEDTSPRDTRIDNYNVSELVKVRPMTQGTSYDRAYREFRFELAEVSEWFRWANNGRSGWHNAEVRGPRDPRPVQRELALV